jgi:ribonucleoside-diphosphate reductase alpha chain
LVTLKDEARKCWEGALSRGERAGYRNAQFTVLAHLRNDCILMDCDTTGVEPDIALVKYKLLAGGGMLKIVNRTVPDAVAPVRLQRRRSSEHHRTHREVRYD